jgi:hypothetical protein
MSAELFPAGLGEVDVVVARSLLDVGERQGAVVIGNVDDLIEARDGISHMTSIA